MDQLCVLTNCSHEQCKQCLSKWIQKAEAGGHKSKPECAFCRIEMTERDAQSILGRPFQPAKATSSPEDTEMDDLTQQWIQEHTQACPHCGSHIEKSGSCDKMECLCGYRFCFRCGSQGAQCNCSPPGHGFLAGLGALPPLAVVNEDTGRVDLGNHIIRRRELEEKKRYREFKDYRLSMEQESLDEFTSSALWLFCPNGTKRLNQHLQTERMKEERFFERVEKELQVERRDEQDVSSCGAWLFCEEKAAQRVLKSKVCCMKENRIVHWKLGLQTMGHFHPWKEAQMKSPLKEALSVLQPQARLLRKTGAVLTQRSGERALLT